MYEYYYYYEFWCELGVLWDNWIFPICIVVGAGFITFFILMSAVFHITNMISKEKKLK